MTAKSIGLRLVLGAATLGASMFAVSAAMAGEVTVWCWDPNFNGATMQEAASRYAATHPDFKINVVDFAKADVEQKLQAQLASGTTDGLPDIVLIEDYRAQKYLQSFPGSFEPLGGAIDMTKFAPYKVELASLNGQSYSVPFDSGVTGFFYRADYLKDAGYSEADLQDITWEQLIDIGKAVEAKTGHKLLSIDINDSGIIRIMMQSAGSWYFTPDGQVSIEGNPVFKAALGAWQKVLQSDIYKPTSGWTDYTGAFASGEVAGTITGVWITATIKANPELAGKWGVAPTPKLDVEGATHASNLGGSSWYVLNAAPDKAEAVDFLKEIWGSDVDFYQKILVNQGALGTLIEARDGPAFQASDEFFSGQPVWQNFTKWLAEIPGVNYGVFTEEADTAVAAQLPALKDGGDLDEAIKAIDAQVKQQTM
jgi:lactose/L-arabinose transport system substrate-binding protein